MSESEEMTPEEFEAQLQPLAVGKGFCFATDMITAEGLAVGFMYRDEPEDAEDSGWRFLSGHESQEYLDKTENGGIYDLNVIANCDEDIIPFLDAPVGSAFEREEETGEFVEVDVEYSEEDDVGDDDDE